MILLMLAGVAAASGRADRPVVVSSLTTQQLLEYCRGKDDDSTANFCTGYILGEFDALSLSGDICPLPARASNIEVAAAVRKYLRARAKKTGTGAPSFVVRDALRDAYPCKVLRSAILPRQGEVAPKVTEGVDTEQRFPFPPPPSG